MSGDYLFVRLSDAEAASWLLLVIHSFTVEAAVRTSVLTEWSVRLSCGERLSGDGRGARVSCCARGERGRCGRQGVADWYESVFLAAR